VWTVGRSPVPPRCGRHGVGTTAVSENAIVAWLDSKVPNSIVYVGFGCAARKHPKQLDKVGHGLVCGGLGNNLLFRYSPSARFTGASFRG
jgi:hypothetical protein